jgi:hypothetical protein
MSSRDGSEKTHARLSLHEAVRRVAAAIAARDGDEFLGPLTRHQERIIAYHIVDGFAPNETNGPTSIIPGRITYSMGGINWVIYPSDPNRRAEVEKALYRRTIYEDQREAALDWLDDHGFDVGAQFIDGAALAQRFEEAFGPHQNSNQAPSHEVRGAPLEPVDVGEKSVTMLPAPSPVRDLRGQDLDDAIRDAVRTAIKKQAEKSGKKLHIGEQRTETMKILRDRGVRANQPQVEKILKEAEFAAHRGPRGVRLNRG